MLKNKVSIITGASKGIGRQIALTFAQQGSNLIINGNAMDDLRSLQDEAQKYPITCKIVQGDIAEEQTSKYILDTALESFNSIDILVNNAGVNSRIPFQDLSADEWNRMLAINLNGVFYTCKAVIPTMMAQNSGSIINISSTASKTAHATASISYGASKAAVNSLTQKLALEMGSYHIRVNGICPGPIETNMSKQWTAEYRENIVAKIPLGLLGTPKNVADVALFLASDMAGFITGETINVNGGSYMN